MKEQYHTFENDNRKAEVFAIWPNKWLVEAYENGRNVTYRRSSK